MSSRDWHQILARGVLSALLFYGFITGNPLWVMVALFHQVPLFATGFQYGFQPLLIGTGISLLLVSLLGGIIQGLVYGFLFLGPCLLLTFQILRHRTLSDREVSWYPIGRSVAYLLGYSLAVTALLSSALLAGDNLQMLEQTMLVGLGQFNKNIEAFYRPHISHLVLILPTFLASFLFIMTLISAILAQNFLEKLQRSIRPTPTMVDFELPWWPWWMLAFLGIITFFGSGEVKIISLNVLGTLLVGFLMEGLAVIHAYARKYEQRNLFLWIFYMLMVVFGWLALPVLSVGIFEPWLNLKERLCKI